jgi:hypothetical protein
MLLLEIVRQLLTEKMTFTQLMRSSTPARKQRARDMKVTKLPVLSSRNGKYWNFQYRSGPSNNTTGQTWKGRISFPDAKRVTSADNLFCEVDCGCPDYKYRWAYANAHRDAGPLGWKSLNKSNGSPPRLTNPKLRPGLCKHLITLKDELNRKLTESQQPNFDDKLNEVVDKYPQFEISYEE